MIYLRNLVAQFEQEVLLVGSELFSGGISRLTTAYLDLLDLEDVVDGPYDAQQAADHDDNDLYGVAHGRVAAGA